MDIHEHVWATIDGSMDTQGLSLKGLWMSMDMSINRAVDIYGHVWGTFSGAVGIYGHAWGAH